jgi:hypothetical protein
VRIPKNAVQNEGSVSTGKEGSVWPEYPPIPQKDMRVFCISLIPIKDSADSQVF